MSITLAGIPAAFSTLALGLGPLAQLTDSALKRKHAAMDRYWNHMLSRCADDESAPDSQQWLRSQRIALASGKLCRERAVMLEQTGMVASIGDADSLSTLAEERRLFTFSPRLLERLGYAAIAAAGPLVFALSGAPISTIAVDCYLSLVLTFILICDVRARIIPYQACIAYGLGALAWVLLAQSFDVALTSMALALASAIVLQATERAALRFTSVSAIGAGDRRLIPLICLQVGIAGFIPGILGLCAVAGAMAVAAIARGASKRSYLPFAPALVAFAMAGTLWPCVSAIW